MKLPSFKRLFSQDFVQQYRQLVDQLSLTINNQIELLYTALNNQLTFTDNFKCTIKSITLTVDVNGNPTGSAGFPINDSSSRILGCIVLSVTNNSTSGAFPTGGVFVSFTQSSSNITINNITGLAAGQSYTLQIVAINA